MTEAQPSLLKTAYFLTGSTDQAHELTQDALVRTYLAWPRVRVDGALAYARRIIVNRRSDHRRLTWREPPTAVLPDGGLPEASVVDDADQLLRLLANLPTQQRNTVVLRYYCDLSEREVSELLGVSTGTVKAAASRGLATLRSTVTNEGTYP